MMVVGHVFVIAQASAQVRLDPEGNPVMQYVGAPLLAQNFSDDVVPPLLCASLACFLTGKRWDDLEGEGQSTRIKIVLQLQSRPRIKRAIAILVS